MLETKPRRATLSLLLVASLVTLSSCYKREFGLVRDTDLDQVRESIESTLVAEGYEVSPYPVRKPNVLVTSALSASDVADAGVSTKFEIQRRRGRVKVRMRVASRQHWSLFWWLAGPHATRWGEPLGERIAETLEPWIDPLADAKESGDSVAHYVLIGVSRYRTSDFPPLVSPESDVEFLRHELARGGVEESRIHAITGRAASESGIRDLLATAAAALSPNDVLVVYFAGRVHSPDGQRIYWVPYDGDRTRPHGTMISSRTLDAAMGTSKSRRQFVMLDPYPDAKTVLVADGIAGWVSTTRPVLSSVEAGGLDTSRDDRSRSPFALAVLSVVSGNPAVNAHSFAAGVDRHISGEFPDASAPRLFGRDAKKLRFSTR